LRHLFRLGFVLILVGCAPPARQEVYPTASVPPATSAPTAMIAATATQAVEATTASPRVTPSPEPVYVRAFCTLIGSDPKTTAPRGAPVIIVWGWGAKTETQVQDHLDNNLTRVTLDGVEIAGTLRDGIFRSEGNGLYEAVWISPVGSLAPGTHIITYDLSWKKRIYDGSNTYGPGGEFETQHDECQLVVE